MKKTILFLTLLTLILTACGAASSSTHQADTAQQSTAIADIVSATQTAIAPVAPIATQAVISNNSATLNTDYTNAATIEMQVLVGIFKLEGTAQAITSEQAKSLITLLTSLQGNTLTQDQITSTVQQMQALLTADQINAIAQMQITQESAMTIMQEQGLSMGGRGQGNGQQPPQDGTLPQGTPPAMPDGQQPTDGQGQPPAQPDGNGPGQGRGMIPPPMLEALIQLLQTRASS
jgi:hypothetical protein